MYHAQLGIKSGETITPVEPLQTFHVVRIPQ
jgi:hypothetical protein